MLAFVKYCIILRCSVFSSRRAKRRSANALRSGSRSRAATSSRSRDTSSRTGEEKRRAEGKEFRLDESDSAAIVSSLAPNVARAALEFMGRTVRRINAVLQGSSYYPEKGEFPLSGGMHLDAGRQHFVAVKNDLRHLKATIVHEMTHASLGHLPLWRNEGLAFNTERRRSDARAAAALLVGGEHPGFLVRRVLSPASSSSSWLATGQRSLILRCAIASAWILAKRSLRSSSATRRSRGRRRPPNGAPRVYKEPPEEGP